MTRAPSTRKMIAEIGGAEAEGAGIAVRYLPTRGHPREVVDYIPFVSTEQIESVSGVGRFLRILRAGRIRAPDDPYALRDDPQSAADLVERCRGALVRISVTRRTERVLMVWTESGVERFSRVLDVDEERDALAVRRRGGASTLRIPREHVVRWEVRSSDHLEVISIESVD